MTWAYLAELTVPGMIHPEDVALLGDDMGGLARVVASDGNWRTVEIQNVRIRVDVSVLIPCPAPDFVYGECVRTVPPRSPREGLVLRIGWHQNFQKPFFLLLVDGKPYKSQFWAHELCRAVP